jgi:hypothetical protein
LGERAFLKDRKKIFLNLSVREKIYEETGNPGETGTRLNLFSWLPGFLIKSGNDFFYE